MKNGVKSAVLSIAMIAAVSVQAKANTSNKQQQTTTVELKDTNKEKEGRIPAIRLISKADGSSDFEIGTIPTLKHLNTTTFWVNNSVEDWEKDVHKAPRRQYVVTLKGRIKFKVTDGSTFIVKPGTVLLAEDTKGIGHSWEMEDEDDDTWVRLYIPLSENAEDFFVPNN